MFRLVGSASSVGRGTDADRPYFWLICDNRNCGVNARAAQPDVELGDNVNEVIYSAMQAMIKHAQAEGWLYAIDGHFCPTHHKAMVEIERAKMAQWVEQQAPKSHPQQQPLVQLGGNDAEIKRLKEMEDQKRRVEEGLRNGFTDKKAVRAN